MSSDFGRPADERARIGLPPLQIAIDELLARIPLGEPFDAAAILADHPELAGTSSAVLDLAYEEFCRRRAQGEVVDPQQFAARFPSIGTSLLRLLEVDQFLESQFSPLAASHIAWPVAGEEWLAFELVEELGRGAYSRVFLARDETLGNRLVVVKATPLGPAEAEMLGKLEHPHIVPVHSVRHDEGRKLTAVCMAFLSRVSLHDVIQDIASARVRPRRSDDILNIVQRLNAARGGQCPIQDEFTGLTRRRTYLDGVMDVGIQLASALSHAHELGVLHCDIKPSNILMTDNGRVVLLDFNLSGSPGALRFVGGTIPYMAPEQLSAWLSLDGPDQELVSQRTDIYSVGVTLFELLYGCSPFGEYSGDDPPLTAARRIYSRQQRGPGASGKPQSDDDSSVAAIIARCLEFDPARRPQSIDELRALLLDQLRFANRGRRWVRQRRRLVLSIAATGAAICLAIAGWWWTRDPFPLREFREGQVAYERGDHAAAESHLSSALKIAPQLVQAQLLRACARFRQDDYVGAHADFRSLATVMPDGRATVGEAHVLSVLGNDNRRAAVLYQQAVEQGYESPIVYNNLGFCLAKAGRYSDAIAALQKATALDPLLAMAHHNLARAEFSLALQQKRSPEASRVEQALRLGPETTTLDLDGAVIYVLRAREAADEPARTQSLDRAFFLLDRAASRGVTPAQLAVVTSVYTALKSDPRWPHLEIRANSKFAVSPAVLLLDPLPQLLARPMPAVSAAPR